MRQIIYQNSIELDGLLLSINANKTQGCYKEILISLNREMKAMLFNYSRVLLFRIDIRLYKHTDNNTVMSVLMRRMKKWIKHHYGNSQIGHLWVREQERKKHQHYHLILMLNGNRVRYPNKIIKRLEYYANIMDLAKPYTPKNCYYLLERDNQSIFKDAFKRGSYLAKERGKGYKGRLANNFSASRVKCYNITKLAYYLDNDAETCNRS